MHSLNTATHKLLL